MRIAMILCASCLSGLAFATLPLPSDEAKAKAAETAAKTAWDDKVALYQLCLATERTAAEYRSGLKAAGKDVPPPLATPPCTDPGPYVSQLTPTTSKPLEAAGAHSPSGAAASPPNTAATAKEISEMARSGGGSTAR